MSWNSYGLDREAQNLVLRARKRDEKTRLEHPKAERSLNEGHKMRTAAAYGLERFWGEHIRYAAKAQQAREKRQKEAEQENTNNSAYWKETWDVLVKVMGLSGVQIPSDSVKPDETDAIRSISEKLWGEAPLDSRGTRFTLEDQRITLAVLTQLCDCIVWWTQRYKVGRLENDDDS